MAIKINKQFDSSIVDSLAKLNEEQARPDLSKHNLNTLCYYYEVCLANDFTNLIRPIEDEFYDRNLPEYIVPRVIFNQFNSSMLSVPFAKIVFETKPLGINLFLQECADRYSPPSYGWLIGYILAAGFKKREVALKIAEHICKYETIKDCMSYFIELTVGMPEISERIVKLYELVQARIARTKKAQTDENLKVQEDIEKHDNLNPVLFEENKLKPEIREKALEVADELLQMLEEAGVTIKLKDIIITGSNASYNYTKDSDVDLHLVADMEGIKDPDQLYPVLFNSFKSAFNRKFDIKFYDIPVEVYIETADTEAVSNGIYSVKNDSWVQEPKNEAIPEINLTEVDKALKPWVDRFEQLESDIEKGKITSEESIDNFITDLYTMREAGLRGKSKSEYSIENLTFKEFRNLGHLDKLKELKDLVISKKLSLVEQLTDARVREATRLRIQQLTHFPPIIQTNGIFEIYNVPENDLDLVLNILRRQDFIESVHAVSSGYDFSRISFGGIPSKKYRVYGQLK